MEKKNGQYDRVINDYMQTGGGVMITFTQRYSNFPDEAIFLLKGKTFALCTSANTTAVIWIRAEQIGETIKKMMAAGTHYCAIRQIPKDKQRDFEKMFEDAFQADPMSKFVYNYATA